MFLELLSLSAVIDKGWDERRQTVIYSEIIISSNTWKRCWLRYHLANFLAAKNYKHIAKSSMGEDPEIY